MKHEATPTRHIVRATLIPVGLLGAGHGYFSDSPAFLFGGALLILAAMLYTHESLELAEVLVQNPAIADDVEILGILANLPDGWRGMYIPIREQAQGLLDEAMGAARIHPAGAVQWSGTKE